MLVYPAAGLRVRDPATGRFVPDDGLEVSDTDLTWARLLRDGDVTTEAPAAAQPEAVGALVAGPATPLTPPNLASHAGEQD